MANNDFNKPHFILDTNVIPQDFTTPSSGGGGKPDLIPAQNRITHSSKLRGDLTIIQRN